MNTEESRGHHTRHQGALTSKRGAELSDTAEGGDVAGPAQPQTVHQSMPL